MEKLKSKSKSKFLNFVKKYPLFNRDSVSTIFILVPSKSLKNGSQFGEEQFILSFFKKDHKGKFVDIGCFHPTRYNNTYKMYKLGWRVA